MNEDEQREWLAEYMHEAWRSWLRDLLAASYRSNHGEIEIPKSAAIRLTRKMNTPYAGLSESEKDIDRAQADRLLGVITWRLTP